MPRRAQQTQDLLRQGRAYALTATGASPQTRSLNPATPRYSNTPPAHAQYSPLPLTSPASPDGVLGALSALPAPTRLTSTAPWDCCGGMGPARGCSVQPRHGDTRGPEEEGCAHKPSRSTPYPHVPPRLRPLEAPPYPEAPPPAA